MQGFLHAYFGKGVGKTTRSVGLAVRASGAGKRVFFFQFLKDGSSSEIEAFKNIKNIDYDCTGTLGFIFDRAPSEEEMILAKNGIEKCAKALEMDYDLVIADELLNALSLGLVEEAEVLEMISKRGPVEVVITGRKCPTPYWNYVITPQSSKW